MQVVAYFWKHYELVTNFQRCHIHDAKIHLMHLKKQN